MASEIVKYKADNGQDIEVTEQDVRDLMAANGNAMENVTAQEIKMFMRLCQSQRLNPFTRDAYIVKYGTKPATVIAGKDAFVKRATRNPRYRGHEAGITVVRPDGQVQRREGSMMLQGESLAGGWAKVYLEGYECPIFEEVALSEYAAPDPYGKNGWSRMPATMIRKVALCHALREAFPEDLGGLYGAEEMDQAQVAEAQVVSVADAAPQQPKPKPEDPRKYLWERAGGLKREAMSLGVKEEGLNSWCAASILNADGTPKDKRDYTDMDLYALCDYLECMVRDAKAVKQPEQEAEYEVVQPELLPEEIPF